MAGTMQAAKSAITIKGSADIVSEFFMYGVNSILYQRGIYPAENFSRAQKYGLYLLVTNDKELTEYLNTIMGQVKEWLLNMTVQKLVMVIRTVDTNEVVERWQFDIKCDKSVLKEGVQKHKSENDINNEIKNVIRQITSSVTFLPLLETQCSFDILVYTDKDLDVPETWKESGPAIISNSQTVPFRTFSTEIHTVQSMVAYKDT